MGHISCDAPHPSRLAAPRQHRRRPICPLATHHTNSTSQLSTTSTITHHKPAFTDSINIYYVKNSNFMKIVQRVLIVTAKKIHKTVAIMKRVGNKKSLYVRCSASAPSTLIPNFMKGGPHRETDTHTHSQTKCQTSEQRGFER